MKQFLLKQYNLGPWLGGFIALFQATTGYVGMVNFFLLGWNTILLTAMSTGLFADLRVAVGALVVGAIVLGFTGMALHYKFITPSAQRYGNIMRYKHGDLLRRDIAELRKEVKELKEILRER